MASQRNTVFIDLTETSPPSNMQSTVTQTQSSVPASARSSSSSGAIVNPYNNKKKKFVGGAQMARQKARKGKKATRILRPGEAEKKSNEVLPKKMNTLERFFASLLRSPASDFLASSNNEEEAVWKTACHRLGLAVPTQPVQPVYADTQTHFDVRAALILEEARNSIAQAMQRLWKITATSSNNNKRGRSYNKRSSMYLTAHITEKSNTHGHTKITFASQRNFTRDQLYDIRPGAVFQILPRDTDDSSIQNAVLGVVLTGNREQVETKKCFACLFSRPDDLPVQLEDVEFVVTPVTQLVTELRCFEAMTTVNPNSISFLHELLGRKSSVHTRFDNNDHLLDDDWVPLERNETTYRNKAAAAAHKRDDSRRILSSSMFHLPTLNATQEEAATSFLQSKQNTITLVQGPPGTGKTTLLVSIICRYLTEALSRPDGECRLMVCAPTNKAITVLASRFLATIKKDGNCPCNAIMVGDAEKLLVEERNKGGNALSTIFLYTWIQSVMQGYSRIKAYFLPRYSGRDTVAKLCVLANELQNRLCNSLPHLSEDILNWTAKITKSLKTLQAGGAAHDIVDTTEKLLKTLKEMPPDAVWTQLLLSANVIFCTLISAGGTILKKTSRINDLIVDEAAAATEPELSVPLHLRPSRMLCVGDPLQLPATVLSRRAIDFGLAKSLHERLMYECDFDRIMLDVQYRMSVQISAFPSARFYDNKIGNGPNVSAANYLYGARLLDRLPYTFLQVEGAEEQSFGGSYHNRMEALKIVELVLQLQDLAHSSERHSWHSAERVRIITFYQAQVSMIKRCLQERGLGNKIVVATVDSSQGCEADTVLISFVRSQCKREARHTAGFLTDDRRMNVALTRAKFQLICVGNIRSFPRMAGAETLKLLAADAEERGVVRSPLATFDDMNARLDMFYGGGDEPERSSKKRLKRG